MSHSAKNQPKPNALQPQTLKPQPGPKTNKAKIAEKNYLQPKPAQGALLLGQKKETGSQAQKPPGPDPVAAQQPSRSPATDSLDQQMSQVDSQLFQSRAQERPAPGPAASSAGGRRARESEAALDDSEFYRSMTMVDNTKDTLVEQNIKTVLERRLEENPAEKTADRLKEKLPMLREGIYRKDFTPQDLALSRPRYGDANNPYDCFSAQPVDEPINSIHRRDFVAKSKVSGEPVHRDVTRSQQDLVKHLRAPAAGDSMYRVAWAHQADFPYWGVVPPPTSILPNNPKTQADGMPFMGKSTSSDYGNFLGIKDKPITIHRHLKTRSPLGPNIPLYSDTEYNSYMKAHDPKAMLREPKYKAEKEAVGPFEGNYQSVYQDFVDHRIGDKQLFESRALRESALKEKEALIVIASRRVMEDPQLGPKVFDATYS